MRLPGFPGMILIRAGKKLWSRQELIAGSLETARRTAFLWRSCGPRRSSGLLWTIPGGSTNWSLCWMTASGRCGDERRQRWPGFRNRMRIASFGLLTGSEALSDDSAYVRWHLVYTLGRLGTSFPVRAPLFLQELLERLEDSNRIVRSFSLQALGCMAARDPRPVEQLFASAKKDVPPPLLRILRASGTEIRKPAGK